MAYAMRREVSLDWHPGSVQDPSRVSLTSRDTLGSSTTKPQLDVVDASIQVDLSRTCVSIDSEDHRKRMPSTSSLEISKKGHPLYSKEDIKEQYCISNKQLKVLQRRRSWKLFTSCLSRDDNSLVTCSPGSVISCVQKRSQNDDPSNRPYTIVSQKQKSASWGPKSGAKQLSIFEKTIQRDNSITDDDFADTYFRKRPKSFCIADPKARFSWMNTEQTEPIGESRILKIGTRNRLSKSQETALTSSSNSIHPTDSRKSLKIMGQSRSLDLLDGDDLIVTSDSMDSSTVSCSRKHLQAGSALTIDSTEDRRRKHVSFESTSILKGRSDPTKDSFNSEELDCPNATSTPMIHRSSMGAQSNDVPRYADRKTQERLLEHSRLLDQALSSSQREDTLPNISFTSSKTKKSCMRTQSTQTDIDICPTTPISGIVPPSYLMLSPRLNDRSASNPPPDSTVEDQCVQTDDRCSTSEEETVESIIVTKYVINGKKKKRKSRPVSLPVTPMQDAPDKEIIVAYKPNENSFLEAKERLVDRSRMRTEAKRKSKKIYAVDMTSSSTEVPSCRHSAREYSREFRLYEFPDDLNVSASSDITIFRGQTETSSSKDPMTSISLDKSYVRPDLPETRLNRSADELSSERIGAKSSLTDSNKNSDNSLLDVGRDVTCSERSDDQMEQKSNDHFSTDASLGQSATDRELAAVSFDSTPLQSPADRLDLNDFEDVNNSRDSVFQSNDETDVKDIDITTILETSPPSTIDHDLILDAPLEPPPNFACRTPVTSPRHVRPVLQSVSLDLPSRIPVSYYPQSVSLDDMLLMSPDSTKSSNEYYTASSAEEHLHMRMMRRHSASPTVALDIGSRDVARNESIDDDDSSLQLRSNSSKKGTLKRDSHVDEDDCREMIEIERQGMATKRMASVGDASDDHTLIGDDSDESSLMLRDVPSKARGNELCSPESDSSSSHFTGRETPKSEGSFDTLKSESDREQHDTSAEYVTATENSHRSRNNDPETRTSLESFSSSFGSPKDTAPKRDTTERVECNDVSTEAETLASLQKAVLNHKQQQRKNFLKEKMARLERRRRQIERGMCSTSTESSNSGSYVVESLCRDEPNDVIDEATPEVESPKPKPKEYPIEVNVTTTTTTNHKETDEGSPKRQTEDVQSTVSGAKLKKHSSSADMLESSGLKSRDKRRTRSASRSPDTTLSTRTLYNRGYIRDSTLAQSYSGVFPIENGRRLVGKTKSEQALARFGAKETRRRRERVYSRSASTESASVRSTGSLSSFTPYPDSSTLSIATIEGADDDDAGVHSESYKNSTWMYINGHHEAAVWKKCSKDLWDSSLSNSNPSSLHRSTSLESTTSEKEFGKKYQSITHRMVHRKASIEMYKRMAKDGKLEVDKCVKIEKKNHEFGFRINGSRPVVVSAIEPDTPAETCSLEVGDIIISINDKNVLDVSHSDVVKLAHTGVDILTLEIARTNYVLSPNGEDKIRQIESQQTGYLYRFVEGEMEVAWRRRWFVLDQQTNILLYYRTEQDQEPMGVIHLSDFRPPEQVLNASRPYTFQISQNQGSLTHLLSAGRQAESNRWMCLITDAITTVQMDPFLNTCVRNSCLPPTSIEDPDCQGYLGSLCNLRSNKSTLWKRRYYILKDACLYIYSDYYAENAIGVCHLHGYKVQTCVIPNKRSTFEAVPPNSKLKHFQFLAESDLEKKKWLAALEYSIDRWMKIS